MKLKNKKTGEIIEVESLDVDSPTEGIVGIQSFDRKGSYNSLAELNEEWEDYEETKGYWCIDWTGGVNHITVLDDTDKYEKDKKQIGNYFETKKEAEKAVEKLKAWKWLKEYGVKFNLDFVKNNINFTYRLSGCLCATVDYEKEIFEKLHLLFGGEE